MSKHTPGPWEIEYDNDDRGGGQWYNVGPVRVWWPYNSGDAKAAAAEADAHLISAAPEMFEALWKIAAYDDKGANERLEKTGSYGAFDEPGSVEMARAALAKVGPIASEER